MTILMDTNTLLVLFPQFGEIKDTDLRSKSINAMLLAMKKGGWDESSIMRCPVTLNWKDCHVTWVEHVNDVTNLCMVEFDKLNKYYLRNKVPFSRDIVVAGALLHDIGKLTEFCVKDGRVGHGEGFELMRHPLSGALIANEAGLPPMIVHLIATHSFEGDKSYQTAESAFVRKIDIFVFENCVKGLEKR